MHVGRFIHIPSWMRNRKAESTIIDHHLRYKNRITSCQLHRNFSPAKLVKTALPDLMACGWHDDRDKHTIAFVLYD